MTAQPEWGPWVAHAPGPCPLPVGTEAMGELEDGGTCGGIISEDDYDYPNSWTGGAHYALIARYRTRRYPAAMALIKGALDVPVKEGA